MSKVIEVLISLLEELSKPYKSVQSHPSYVLHSEFYILELLADCCTAHWNSADAHDAQEQGDDRQSISSKPSLSDRSNHGSTHANLDGAEDKEKYQRGHHSRSAVPDSLEDALVGRMLACIYSLLLPLRDGYSLPSAKILGETTLTITEENVYGVSSMDLQNKSADGAAIHASKAADLELCASVIIEFVSASNWSVMVSISSIAFFLRPVGHLSVVVAYAV